MRKHVLVWVTLLLTTFAASAQHTLPSGWWRAELLREDSLHIVFNLELKYEKSQPVWYVRNASERIAVNNVRWKNDSLIIHMPLFESVFYLRHESPRILTGKWVRGTAMADLEMPVRMVYGERERFPGKKKKPAKNISGRWEVTFFDDKRSRPAIAEFKQRGNKLTGTFLTPTGDYRYLEGAVSGNQLQLSTFDGHHAYYFDAVIDNDSIISNGRFTSGPAFLENWKATRKENASLPDTLSAVYLKPGEDRLDFRFPDLDSQLVSIHDERFRNKVVIVQLMGSWCANCMDETAFLSEFYNKNRQRGIEVVALAYEYSTDFQRSKNSLEKFRQRFNIQYPMLITGIRSNDELRTEKTLPQLTTIRMLPTTIFIGMDGKVKKIHTGFNGPGTGVHYERFKKEFNAIVEELLNENSVQPAQ